MIKNIYKQTFQLIEKQSQKIIELSQQAFKGSAKKVALVPGTLVYVGEERSEPPKISLINYSAQLFEEKSPKGIEETFEFRDKDFMTWVNVDGVHDVKIIEKLGNYYGIHPLVLEDVVHTNQRAKLKSFDGYLYIILRMFYLKEGEEEIESEQVSLMLGKDFLFSFQEKSGDVFNAIRIRIKNGKYKIRTGGSSYLAYALIDAIVDHYFVVLEKIGESLGLLEEAINQKPDPSTLNQVHKTKRELFFLRKSIWPLREVVNELIKGESPLIPDDMHPFFKDVYDHTVQVVEAIEAFYDTASGLQDLYMNVMSNRMNEVMKVLTIIATLFIPPTFIAGIYGMNFDHMPELHVKTGYFFVLGAMAASIIGMLFYFKQKKWF